MIQGALRRKIKATGLAALVISGLTLGSISPAGADETPMNIDTAIGLGSWVLGLRQKHKTVSLTASISTKELRAF